MHVGNILNSMAYETTQELPELSIPGKKDKKIHEHESVSVQNSENIYSQKLTSHLNMFSVLRPAVPPAVLRMQ